MSTSPRNSGYAFTEIVKVVVEIEIAYDKPSARGDAVQAAQSLCSMLECGGAGMSGSYNAVRLQTPVVAT